MGRLGRGAVGLVGQTCENCGLVSPDRMRFCGGCGRQLHGSSEAGPASAVSESAQRRHVTVMFCDLVGSTPLAEALDPEDLREVILGYQQACVRAVERFDGHIAKYIGDGLLVYFGYPRAHEDDPIRAVHAGLGILDELVTLNVGLRERYGIDLHVRIGVHTGLVVAGEMGSGSTREELAIVGETPNIAARIESIADTDSVAISDATLALVEGVFETAPLGQRVLKGVSRDVGVSKVIRATGVRDRLDRSVGRRASPMIGRARELELLMDAWASACGGRGVVAHISGEAGIGKSRLVRSFAELLAERAAIHVLRCSAYRQNSAYFPVIDHLERTLGLAAGDRSGSAMDVLAGAVAGAGIDPEGAVPLLAALLSLPVGGQRAPLAPLDARVATLRVLERLLLADPSRRPVLLIVEDLHWADPSSVELMRRIVTGSRDVPVLVAFTFRPDFSPPWSVRDGVDIALRPLSNDEVSSMVASAAGTVVDETVIARVVEAADGVPLFVEEMLKLVRAADVGSDDGSAPERVTVPPTLRGLLTERLDGLPEFRDVIDAAAVVGREVSSELLEGVTRLASEDVERALASLVAHGVLRPLDATDPRFEFTHALLQEAAYDSVLRKQRQALHLRLANVLTERFAERVEREPEVVAHHLACGGREAASVPYWHAAGLLALERAAFVEAAGRFQRGIDAIDASDTAVDDATRGEFLSHLAASTQAGRGYAAQGVDGIYARARAACISAGREDRIVSVIRGEWLFAMLRARYGAAFDLAAEMLTLATRHSRREELAEGHLLRGMVHMYRGELEAARSDLEQAIDEYVPSSGADRVYEAQGDTGVMALAYLAPVLHNMGLLEASAERSEQSLELADRVGGAITRAQAWGMRTLLLLGRGDMELVRWAERTRSYSTERNIPYWRSLSEMITGWLRGRSGDLDAGAREMETALAQYLDSGNRLGLALFRSLLADLYAHGGDRRRALDEIEAGEAFIAETGERYTECRLLIAKAQLLMDGDDAERALAGATLSRALHAAREQGATLLELRTATYLTRYEDAAGQSRTETDTLVRLCERFADVPDLAEVNAARAVLAVQPAG